MHVPCAARFNVELATQVTWERKGTTTERAYYYLLLQLSWQLMKTGGAFALLLLYWN